jgi:glycosyltransferase involved in cell wall biosynthesis
VAASAGLPSDRLHALGRLDDPDLAAVLAGATVLAAPSRSEGFGLPVLEAMAAGVPVVCSDAPALAELVGGAGLVVRREDPVALADALAQVFLDESAADEFAARGSRRALDFSWAAAATSLWDLHTGSAT